MADVKLLPMTEHVQLLPEFEHVLLLMIEQEWDKRLHEPDLT